MEIWPHRSVPQGHSLVLDVLYALTQSFALSALVTLPPQNSHAPKDDGMSGIGFARQVAKGETYHNHLSSSFSAL
jgi:hypothetical protein